MDGNVLFVMPEILSRASMALNVDSRLRTAGMTAQTMSVLLNKTSW